MRVTDHHTARRALCGVYVQFEGGVSEMRDWPGGKRGTIELPDRAGDAAIRGRLSDEGVEDRPHGARR